MNEHGAEPPDTFPSERVDGAYPLPFDRRRHLAPGGVLAPTGPAFRSIEEALRADGAARVLQLDVPVVSPRLGELTGLHFLFLEEDGTYRLPSTLGRLRQLRVLVARHNPNLVLPDAVGELSSLLLLDVNECRLGRLPDTIGGLASLRTLLARENDLTSLPESLGDLGALLELDLSENRFVDLPAVVGALPSLRHLRLAHGGQLRSLPSSLGGLERLEMLQLSWCGELDVVGALQVLSPCPRLADLRLEGTLMPERFTVPPSVRRLDWSHPHGRRGAHRALPDALFDARGLEALEIGGNAMTTVPARLAAIEGLKRLSLSHNRIARLPAALGALTHIEELVLSANDLAALPAVVCELASLRSLDLYSNELRALPAAIGWLARLEVLTLAYNRVTRLPAELGRATALRDVDLEGNPVERLEGLAALTSLPALSRLSVRRTPLARDGAELDRLRAALPNVTVVA